MGFLVFNPHYTGREGEGEGEGGGLKGSQPPKQKQSSSHNNWEEEWNGGKREVGGREVRRGYRSSVLMNQHRADLILYLSNDR